MAHHDPWHVNLGTHKRGPMPFSEVVRGIKLGKVTAHAHVYTPSMKGWTPIMEVAEFAHYLAPTEPPPTSPASPVKYGLDYVIHGDEVQHLEITLAPGESCYSEASALIYMEPGIKLHPVYAAQGEEGFWAGLVASFDRMSIGEDGVLALYRNESNMPQRVALTAATPGRILALEVRPDAAPIHASPHAFFAASNTLKMHAIARAESWFYNANFQHFTGDGNLFLQTSGNIIRRELAAGEALTISLESMLAISGDLNRLHILHHDSMSAQLDGLTGLELATLTGPLRVWLHTQPMSRQVREVWRRYPPAPPEHF